MVATMPSAPFRRPFRVLLRRTVLAGMVTILAALPLTTAATPASAGALPSGCENEQGSGLCVSLGFGVRPAGWTGPSTKNVVAYAEGTTPMPFDYYVRSDIAAQIAAGTAKPRAAIILLAGGAFVCGSRADLSPHARELADRGYIVVAPEYPLAGALSAYGYYKPNPGYSQASRTTPNANSCDGFSDWVQTAAWKAFLGKLRQKGLEPVLQQDQWVLQALIRTLKTDPSYGVDPKRIFAIGTSAGGSVALRLASSGNQDNLPSGKDPGDSTIAGALSVSGPACFAGSTQDTDPMLGGQITPSQMPACKSNLDPADPPVMMLQEPRGGVDDWFVPDSLMMGGCSAIQAAGDTCLYDDATIADGGFLAHGAHSFIAWPDWMRLFDDLEGPNYIGQP
jgi:dienelactone hydrolase